MPSSVMGISMVLLGDATHETAHPTLLLLFIATIAHGQSSTTNAPLASDVSAEKKWSFGASL